MEKKTYDKYLAVSRLAPLSYAAGYHVGIELHYEGKDCLSKTVCLKELYADDPLAMKGYKDGFAGRRPKDRDDDIMSRAANSMATSDRNINIRVNGSRRAAYQLQAKAEGVSFTQWVLKALDMALASGGEK